MTRAVPTVRAAGPGEHAVLLAIWRRAVEATHDFLTTADVDFYESSLRDGHLAALALTLAEVDGVPLGFAGVDGDRVEMLFVDPDHHGRGVGTVLLAHLGDAVAALDVNEQNPDALAFYRARGFVVTGRSETDGTGRPFPVLHLRRG